MSNVIHDLALFSSVTACSELMFLKHFGFGPAASPHIFFTDEILTSPETLNFNHWSAEQNRLVFVEKLPQLKWHTIDYVIFKPLLQSLVNVSRLILLTGFILNKLSLFKWLKLSNVIILLRQIFVVSLSTYDIIHDISAISKCFLFLCDMVIVKQLTCAWGVQISNKRTELSTVDNASSVQQVYFLRMRSDSFPILMLFLMNPMWIFIPT